VTGYQKDSITCDVSGETCTMASDTVTGIGPTPLAAQNAFRAGLGTLASIERRTLSGHSYNSAL
jgi:hypothetical protein